MTLDNKVAKLSSTDTHKGTAWLISSTHALTAAHCIRDADGTILKNLTLTFFELAQTISVQVAPGGISDCLDVALLEVVGNAPDLSNRIIPLSRRACQKNDKCDLRGYPEVSGRDAPAGVEVSAKIQNSKHVMQHGENQCRVIQLVDATVSGGMQGTTELQGASGGVLVCAGEAFAVGILLQEILQGQNLIAAPVMEVAKVFPVVREALDNSPHVDQTSRRITIGIQDDGCLIWSGLIEPKDACKIWSDASPITHLDCSVPLSRLGIGGSALVRLFAHSKSLSVTVPDPDTWRKIIETNTGQLGISLPSTLSVRLHLFETLDNEDAIVPSPPKILQTGDLGRELNQALDSMCLQALHDRAFSLLQSGHSEYLGCEPEANLANAMWATWDEWHKLLDNDLELLSHVLIRLVSTNGEELAIGKGCISVGPTRELLEHQFRALMFSVALAASGVDLRPDEGKFGNLMVTINTGHACGATQINRKAVSTSAVNHSWKTEVVILPALQGNFVDKARGLQRMQDSGETVRLADLGPHPSVVTEEILPAIEKGAEAVKTYFNNLRNETAEYWGKRTEGTRRVS